MDFYGFMNNLTVIARENCIYCEMAKRLLKEKNIKFKLLMLGTDFQREDFNTLVPGAKTFPQIIINGVSIGGYEELLAKIETIC